MKTKSQVLATAVTVTLMLHEAQSINIETFTRLFTGEPAVEAEPIADAPVDLNDNGGVEVPVKTLDSEERVTDIGVSVVWENDEPSKDDSPVADSGLEAVPLEEEEVEDPEQPTLVAPSEPPVADSLLDEAPQKVDDAPQKVDDAT